jgi:homospermidine synthase
MTELHVIPDERTTWRVYEDDASGPLSEHTNATDAEHAALMRADDRDARRVVVHDRYHRTHDAARSRAELRARARSARARQLALVRERVRQLARPRTP